MPKDKSPPTKARSERGARAESKVSPKAAKRAPDPKADGMRAATGRFQAGNRFWAARASSGPQPLFTDSEALWAACDAYFCWVEDHPLYETQLVSFQGIVRHELVPKMRPMTKRGLCRFLGIAHTTWAEWKRGRPELASTIERAESVIWDQKFGGAAAGLLNANIIARELGLADKTEHMGKDGGPIQHQDLEPKAPPKDVLESWVAQYRYGAERHGRGDDDN